MATEDEYEGHRACSAYFSDVMPEPGTAAYPSLCWPEHKRELKVYFEARTKIPTWRLNDQLQRLIGPKIILEWANLWSKDTRSSVPRFEETEDKKNSDIRVLLTDSHSSGGQSVLGTTAASHRTKITMVLNFSKNDDDYRQFLAVHEFGHALGLGHPHQLSCLADALDEDATKQWLQRVCGLSPEESEEKFRADFHVYTGVSVPDIGTFDAASVMCYPIGAECFIDDKHGGLSDKQFELLTNESFAIRKCPSQTDILTIHKLYKGLTSAAAEMPGHTPTQQRSTLSQLSDELRSKYAKYQLPHFSNPQSRWMHLVSKKYIHPAIAGREDQEEQLDTHKEAVLRRGSHGITEEGSGKPVQLAELLSSVKPGEQCEVVLVEGAPGIGKSTLVWQVCHLWGKRELFDQYSIVLLLPLRDKRVQDAKHIVDPFFHAQDDEEDKKAQDKAKRDVGTGCGTLIILDGLDELPAHLVSQQSIFTDLLSGEVLGDATILVTSRPSATQQLLTQWKQRLSKHYVIHGFSEDHIQSYVQSMLSGEKLTEFQEYLSIHLHIQSLMYVPLHSAIVMAVYMQCKQLPKTITDLYKWLVKIILNQYLKDNPECNKEEQVFDLTLPRQVYANFKELCRLAFDHVCSRQLIFSHLPKHLHNLGFTDSVPELFLPGSCSYNFLHLTVQEFLAAYHVSHMSTHEQEQLLLRSHEERHFRNVMRFVAGLTKFEGFSREALQQAIKVQLSHLVGIPREGHCSLDALESWMVSYRHRTKKLRLANVRPGETLLDEYSVELLYECQNVSPLDGENAYKVYLSDPSPYHSLAVGYCISNSKCTWKLKLEVSVWNNTNLAMFIQGLTDSRAQPGYTIGHLHIKCRLFAKSILQSLHKYESFSKLLLLQAPEYFPAHIKHLKLTYLCEDRLITEDITNLCSWLKTPTCQLETLSLNHLQSDDIEMLSRVISQVSSLTTLNANFLKFTLQSMQVFASMLRENQSLTEVNVRSDAIDDDCVCCLAEALHNNTTLRKLNIKCVGQKGAEALRELHKCNTILRELNVEPIYVSINIIPVKLEV